MRTRTRLIGLLAAGALLVGCGSTTAGTGVLGTVAGAPPATSDQVQAPDTTAEDAPPVEDTTDEDAPPTVDDPRTETEEPGSGDTGGEDTGGDTGDTPADPGMPTDLDGCMAVSTAYLSILFGSFATDQSELDQVLTDIDTALASAPEDIKPALQTLADLSKQAQGKPIDEWSAILGSPEYTAASDEISKWLETACGGA